MLILCSVINITFLILRQRNIYSRRTSDMKVKRSKIVNEHETERERLLSEDSDEGQGSRSRSSSKTKLLGGCDERVYSSCSGDTGNGSCVKCSEGCKEQTDKYTAKGLFVKYKFLIDAIAGLKHT